MSKQPKFKDFTKAKKIKDEKNQRFGKQEFKNLRGGARNIEQKSKSYKQDKSEDKKPRLDRIAKYLARCGLASRRNCELIVNSGRITVNGKIVKDLALKVTGEEKICLDNKEIAKPERARLWLYHKPAGFVTTNKDEQNRATIFDNLPKDLPRVMSVGRLDINTEGLLLLTNDGELARILELPNTGWLRKYKVRAFGQVTQAKLDELQKGICVEGIFYSAIEAKIDKVQGSNIWLTMGLREGKNREIKNVLASLGLQVNRLIRLSFGPFQLLDLKEGEVKELKESYIRDQLGDRLMHQLRDGEDPKQTLKSSSKTNDSKDKKRGDLRNRKANVFHNFGDKKPKMPQEYYEKMHKPKAKKRKEQTLKSFNKSKVRSNRRGKSENNSRSI